MLVFTTQAFECRDHICATGQFGTGLVGPEFALAREPHDDGTGQEAEHNFGHERGDVVTHANTAFIVIPAQERVHGVADDPGKEHDKSINNALNQTKGDHIAVGNVTDFMTNDRPGLIGVKPFQQSLADGHQGGIFVPAGGKGIRFVGGEDTHLGHVDASLCR